MRRTSINFSERDDANKAIIIEAGFADNPTDAIRVALARFAATVRVLAATS